ERCRCFCDDVDYARECIRAVKSGAGTVDDLDLPDVSRSELIRDERLAGDQIVHLASIDQEQRVRERSDKPSLPAEEEEVRIDGIDARDEGEDVLQIAKPESRDVF